MGFGNTFDGVALLQELKRLKMSVPEAAKAIGISKVTLYRKIAGESEFNLREIRWFRELMGVEATEKIFFAPEVA